MPISKAWPLLHNDPDVMRFLNGVRPTSRREIEREYRERFAKDGYWVAIERATGDFIGWFGFHPREDRGPHEFEFGYRLCEIRLGPRATPPRDHGP